MDDLEKLAEKVMDALEAHERDELGESASRLALRDVANRVIQMIREACS